MGGKCETFPTTPQIPMTPGRLTRDLK
jgi:hypothetical protein